MNFEEAILKLKKYNQEHLLGFYDELTEDEKTLLIHSIEQTDFSVLEVKGAKKEDVEITPIKTLSVDEIKKEKSHDRVIGLNALKEGKLACLLLAGGMGSRLGFDKPKGMFNVGVNKTLSIFECQLNTIKKVVDEIGKWLYVFIMTSPINDKDTRYFFEDNNYFGYDKEHIKFFVQDEFPVTDLNGKVLFTNKYTPATAPNGNGGWFLSLKNCGYVDFCKEKGIEYFNVYAVDNVLQNIADPVFFGAIYDRNYECGAKVVRKADVNEKVGVMCKKNGRPSVVEYIELTDELRYSKDDKEEYLYNYGVILNYLFKIDALERTLTLEFPVYKALKKYPYMDENGNVVNSTEPNAYKSEIFILDMISLMETCLPFEVERNKEFAPIKNLHGVDSVESARELLKENGIEF